MSYLYKEPAFPCDPINLAAPGSPDRGLTKMEYFTALAFHALLSGRDYRMTPQDADARCKLAEAAFLCADAMLLRLEK